MYILTDVVRNYTRGRQAVAALRGVDLVVRDGEWLAIQGPTGHGKSTLLQIMGALDRPTSGSVELGGIDLSTLREAALTRIRARSIGFIFQTFNLIPTLNAADNVATALVPQHIARAERQSRAEEALAAVGPGQPPAPPAVRAVRRRAATRGHRSGPGQGTTGAPGRRADRQPRRRHPGRGHQPAGKAVARARADHGHGHARQQRGRPRSADWPAQERPPGHLALGGAASSGGDWLVSAEASEMITIPTRRAGLAAGRGSPAAA